MTSYLFNFEIINKHTLPTIKQKDIPNLDTDFLMYSLGKDIILNNYSRPQKNEIKTDIFAEINRVEKNLSIIESCIVEMPNT